jgi:hypothetical protein
VMTIGEFTFATKRAATVKVQHILHSSPHGLPLSGNDERLILALLGMHHEADEKIGAGIRCITVAAGYRGAPGFWVHRVDGTAVDFSYKRCLDGAPRHRTEVLKAMRASVEDQVLDYRRQAFAQGAEPVCPVSGVVLTNDPSTHVDHHEPTFIELCEAYANECGGFDSIAVVPSTDYDGEPRPQLAPPHSEHFPKFHRRGATLRLLHWSANLGTHRLAEVHP